MAIGRRWEGGKNGGVSQYDHPARNLGRFPPGFWGVMTEEMGKGSQGGCEEPERARQWRLRVAGVWFLQARCFSLVWGPFFRNAIRHVL